MTTIKKIVSIRWQIIITLSVIFMVGLLLSSDFEPADSLATNNTLSATPPTAPDSLLFAGEIVPIEYFDVKESLERELMVNIYWHSQTIWLIQKANRFFPLIEPILKENNLPNDFKYLAVAESGLSQTVSPAKAVGFWQIIEGTAKDYGLEVNDEVDERYHIEKSTEFACKYIYESYIRYGSWTLAAASYNVGRRGVDRQLEKQKETNYYNLLFNDETARYIYRILAFKIIFENPEKYGFYIPDNKLYQPYSFEEDEVSGDIISWADYAKEKGTNYKMLKTLNPWLRSDKLTNGAKKTYRIKIPSNNTRQK